MSTEFGGTYGMSEGLWARRHQPDRQGKPPMQAANDPQERLVDARHSEPSAMTRGLVRNALIVFAIALAARWATDVVLQPHLGTYVIDDYDIIGQNVLDGHGFSYQSGKTIPTVTRAPFYPLWWAAELTVFGRRFLLLRMGEGLVDAVTAGLVIRVHDGCAMQSPAEAWPPAIAGCPTD